MREQRFPVNRVGDDDVVAGDGWVQLADGEHHLIAVGRARHDVGGDGIAAKLLSERYTGTLQNLTDEHAFVGQGPSVLGYLDACAGERFEIGWCECEDSG